jgi:mannosyl-oligosaccharide alpha-1,2-mannosidase
MHFHQLSFLPLLGYIVASSTHPSPCGDNDPLCRYQANHKRAAAIKEAFQFSWNNYYEYAFPHDSLRPLDRSGEDDRWDIPTSPNWRRQSNSATGTDGESRLWIH